MTTTGRSKPRRRPKKARPAPPAHPFGVNGASDADDPADDDSSPSRPGQRAQNHIYLNNFLGHMSDSEGEEKAPMFPRL